MLIASITIFAGLSLLFIFTIYRVPIWLWATFFCFTAAALLWRWYLVVENQNAFSAILQRSTELLAISFIIFSIPFLRRIFLVRPIFVALKKRLSPLSAIEKQALDAGGAGFERGLFSGYPDWEALRATSPVRLTEEEQAFLRGPAEEMCRMINDWSIRYESRKIPDHVWHFARKHGFLGLRVPKRYGGPAFSFQAQSIILGKIASRSLDVSTIVEVPNSLGPDELIEKYGTKEQKEYYLPRFAQGEEIISFAITSPSGGSDAAAMQDVGSVVYGIHENRQVLGIRLTWDKRFITFAPQATLIVLAFHLLDPDDLLKQGKDIGITLALLPAGHPGVVIGRRHLIGGAAFPNGPIRGKDVFIPVDWIIGGTSGAGKGWKMIMECLFVGRAISLPSMSVATIKAMLRYSTAYSRVRRQFGLPIGTTEGVEEPLVRLSEMAYLTEAARAVTASMADSGERPIAIASLMKYQTTEYARRAINDTMDIHGGRAICDGPLNYLQSAYQMAPVGITVEGANIITRSLITFAQGVLRGHPHLYEELEGCSDLNEKRGLTIFEGAFLKHISLLVSNICRAFFHNVTGGIFGCAPRGIPNEVTKWYRQLWRESCNFACVTDIIALLLQGHLKKKQKIGGRLADSFSELYLLSCVLKRYEDDGFPKSDRPLINLCMRNGLYRFQDALNGVICNFPNTFVRLLLRTLVYPFGANRIPAPDNLGHDVVKLVLEPGEVRDRLTRDIYVSSDRNDPIGLLEIAFQSAVVAEPVYKKVKRAIRNGTVSRFHGRDWISDAKKQGILTEQEALDIRESETLAERVIDVDDFDPDKLELISKLYRNPKIRGIRGKNGADEGGVDAYSD